LKYVALLQKAGIYSLQVKISHSINTQAPFPACGVSVCVLYVTVTPRDRWRKWEKK